MELQCLHKLAKRISSFSISPSSLQAKVLIVILLTAAVSTPSNASAGIDDASLNRAQIAVIQKARQGMEATLAYIKQRPDLFPGIMPETEHVLSLEDRQEVREIWARFLDYQLSLDSIAQRQDRWQSSSNDADFSLGYASFLTRYRFALDFIGLIDNDPAVRIVLNEAIPELGLPERSYADFKFHYLNVAIASRFATLYTLNKAIYIQLFCHQYKKMKLKYGRLGKAKVLKRLPVMPYRLRSTCFSRPFFLYRKIYRSGWATPVFSRAKTIMCRSVRLRISQKNSGRATS